MSTRPTAPMMPEWAQQIARYRGLVAPVGFVLLVAVIVVPLPPALMDVLIAFNIALSIIILMTTMYMKEPLDFSVFPSLLLGVTLLRLVLNVASTRLILTAEASSPEEAVGVAGEVISAFGSFVAGGSLVVGVILFLILVIIQFIVITKGATRISEVAARFTLDAMPGKQMAIDADLNAGIINEKEARERRERISQEADFFGAMDGASKFVRGDAIAGIIITFVNIIGGFIIGWLMKGWEPAKTAEVFTILTIGDGLSSQIPAFIVSIAAALIVTRSSARADLGSEMTAQIGSNPTPLYITAAFVSMLALTPLPALPLIALGALTGGLGWFMSRQEKNRAAAVRAEESRAAAAPALPPPEDLLKVEIMELELGISLVSLVDKAQGDLVERIGQLRRTIAADVGFLMPSVRIRDNPELRAGSYRLKIRGSAIAEGELRPGMLLALNAGIATGPIQGEKTRDSVFGLDAWWIQPALKHRAESLNYTVIEPALALITHIQEVVRDHADELLTREEVSVLLAQAKQRAPKLVEETVPKLISTGELQKVLQSLLRERVPIRDLETILETLADMAPRTKDADVLTQYVRHALRRTISQQYAVPADPARAPASPGVRRAAQRIVCVTVDPGFEDLIRAHFERTGQTETLSMPASVAQMIVRQVADGLRPLTEGGHLPVVVTSPQVRSALRQIIEAQLPTVVVLGHNEIAPGIDLETLGFIMTPEPAGAAASAAA
ncbi:MAG: flagellar biosynthesis protein FlhA [Planctomycetota bacterium]|nr:flagellar biosynthesis protein FlhA [Planctomycetota bacterium]